MKKLFTLFTLSLFVVLGFATNVKAADEIILYPYDQEACLNATSECTYTKLGDSFWDVTFNGYLYNVARGNARFVVDFDDENSDGFIDSSEMTLNGWSSFGGIIINDTDEEVELKTTNQRADILGSVHRIAVYFDEDGKLAMFEDHYVTKHYIFNDGTTEAPDWRLATQAEADAYDAADPKPETTMLTTIRMALDDVDTDGYVIEPLASLKWTALGVDVATAPVADWSSIIAGDPNNIVIPAGWTVMTYGSWDRDGTNAKTVNWIKAMPAALEAGTEVVSFDYTDQPASFTGITPQDDDLVTPGVNVVVDYNGEFDLENTVVAKWLNMFDDTTGKIINSVENLDYSVTISRDGIDLETIDFTWNATTEEYTASGPVTVIDSSEFGAGYTATYSTTSPAGNDPEVMMDIVVGVMPPKFVGVADRYVNEDIYVDLLAGITANDGYSNDKTSSIMVSYPAGFNPYNVQPGEYQIDLEFTHHVHFDGVASSVTINGVTSAWNVSGLDSVTSLSAGASSNYAIFTDSTMVHDVVWGYGTVLALIGADGKVDAVYDRYTWDITDENGESNDGGASFETWKAAVAIEDGGFVIGSYGSTLSTALRALAYDDMVSYELGKPDFDYDIVTEASYMLTVDDKTAPTVIVVNEDKYMIEIGEYKTANTAILANVVAFDNFDENSDLAIYVSDNGGLTVGVEGVYTVEVTVEDVAGNSTVVEFHVEVVPGPLSEEEVQAMIDVIDTLTPAQIQALLDGQDLLTEADVQALIDASTPVDTTGCGSAINGVSALFVTVTAILGTGVLFVLRKRS